MAIVSLEEFADAVPSGTTIAGLDLGTKTIGLAVSDLGQRFATPRKVLRRTKFTADANALVAALNEDSIVGIVKVG